MSSWIYTRRTNWQQYTISKQTLHVINMKIKSMKIHSLRDLLCWGERLLGAEKNWQKNSHTITFGMRSANNKLHTHIYPYAWIGMAEAVRFACKIHLYYKLMIDIIGEMSCYFYSVNSFLRPCVSYCLLLHWLRVLKTWCTHCSAHISSKSHEINLMKIMEYIFRLMR